MRRLRCKPSISHFLRAVVAICWLCVGSCAGPTDTEAETRFREMFASSLSSSILIAPDKHQYRRDETIIFWVENRAEQAVWFHDQSFAVQALTYDAQAEQWSRVDLGFFEGSPAPTRVEPGVSKFPGILPVEYIDVPEGGRIRLVVTGHTDLANWARDRAYTAYTDIQIVD